MSETASASASETPSDKVSAYLEHTLESPWVSSWELPSGQMSGKASERLLYTSARLSEPSTVHWSGRM